MQIIHKIDYFFFTNFPEIKGKAMKYILQIFQDYNNFKAIKPKVIIKVGLVEIEIDSSAIISQKINFKRQLNSVKEVNKIRYNDIA